MNATTEEITAMSTTYEQLHAFNLVLQQLEQYIRDQGIKMPLLVLIEATPAGINVKTVMDVSYESYSFHVEFPKPILEVTYTGVKHRIVGDRFFDVGPMCVRLEVGEKGRVYATEINKVEYLQKIDVHI